MCVSLHSNTSFKSQKPDTSILFSCLVLPDKITSFGIVSFGSLFHMFQKQYMHENIGTLNLQMHDFL